MGAQRPLVACVLGLVESPNVTRVLNLNFHVTGSANAYAGHSTLIYRDTKTWKIYSYESIPRWTKGLMVEETVQVNVNVIEQCVHAVQ